jgi:hypothetical protein
MTANMPTVELKSPAACSKEEYDRFRKCVGWASGWARTRSAACPPLAVRHSIQKMVGTAQMRLCPPYALTATCAVSPKADSTWISRHVRKVPLATIRYVPTLQRPAVSYA